MTEQQFLNELRDHLKGFSQAEIEEIIQDHREIFREGRERQRSEQEISESLGPPDEIAASLKLQTQLDRFATPNSSIATSLSRLGKILLSIAILAPLHFLMLFGPLLISGSVLFSFWVTGLTVLLVAICIAPLLIIIWPLDFWGGMTSVAAVASTICLSFVFLGITYWATQQLFRLVKNYLIWSFQTTGGVK